MPCNTAPNGGRRSFTISLALSVSSGCLFSPKACGLGSCWKDFFSTTPCTAIIQFLEVLKFVIKNKASSGEQQQQFIIKAKQKAKLDLKRKSQADLLQAQDSTKNANTNLETKSENYRRSRKWTYKLNLLFLECLEKKGWEKYEFPRSQHKGM